MASEDLLLDTHLLLWSAEDPRKLSRKARRLLEDPSNTLFFSALSIWEIAVKHARMRSDFGFEPGLVRRSLLDAGYKELALTGLQALRLSEVPMLHRDPFDRMLVAQALSEGLTLLTSDKAVAKYPRRIVLV